VGLTDPEWAGLCGDPTPADGGGGDLGLRGETSLLVAEGDAGLLSKEMESELIKENNRVGLSLWQSAPLQTLMIKELGLHDSESNQHLTLI